MEFLDGQKIDERGTAHNVDLFLTKDLEKALRFSGESRDGISSPQWSFEPSGGGYGNSQERRVGKVVTASNMVKAIADTIRNCDELNSKILFQCYIDEMKDWQVATKLGYTKEHFSRQIKRSALVEFADRYEVYGRFYHVYEDLHVYLA